MSIEITSEYLRSILHYDPETGVFVWQVDRANGAIKAGSLAGNVYKNRHGYKCRQIKIGHKCYYAHRLAWIYVTGEWPPNQIDHIDLDATNNKWKNLRLANTTQNRYNQFKRKNNTSGFKGVSWHKRIGKWAANICADGRARHLGYFVNQRDAVTAYEKAALELHGAFARY